MASPHGTAHPTPWTRTRGLIHAERQDLFVVAIYSIAVGLLSLALPVATQALVNTVAFGVVLQPLVVLSVLVFAALSAAAVLQCLRFWVVEMIQRRVFAKLATQVADRLLRVQLEAFDRRSGPELVNRFLDVVTVQKSVALLLIDGLSLVMQVAIGMFLLAAYHPYLLVFDIALLLLIALVLFGLGRGAVRTSVQESHAKYDVLAWLEEVARHRFAFRSRLADAYARERTTTLVGAYLRERGSHFRILLRQMMGTLTLQACATSALLGIGGWLVIEGQLTLGQLIAAELVVGMIVSSLAKFGKSLESFYDLQAAMDKLGYLTDLPVERTNGESFMIAGGPAGLRLRDVTYSYPGHRGVLRAPSMEIAPGARVALHGPSGSGKSTLLDLLFALRTPSSGRIEIDGVDYREARLSLLRDQIALVRDADIFPGTVLENVRVGSHIDVAEVRRALHDVGLLEEVAALPEGLQTPLASGGAPLSPSQAMRLAIARALLAKPRLLLLDEVLDQIDDLKIRGPLVKTLFTEKAPWTLIVTTEREDLWPLCDQVLATDPSGDVHPDSQMAVAQEAGRA
ncbi:MAG TPA: ABC transporter ATP-binding protein [Bryobacteraceae bacterium]|nr:ABC transporter ATP-binding protein [Bryobacteraceae bacterium]